jgi:hypothetical protein
MVCTCLWQSPGGRADCSSAVREISRIGNCAATSSPSSQRGFLSAARGQRIGIQGVQPIAAAGDRRLIPGLLLEWLRRAARICFAQRPKSQDRTVFDPTDNFTILRGRHSLKFGVLVRYYQWIGYDSSNNVGIFNFTGVETQNTAALAANFLLGYPASVARAYPANDFGGQRWYFCQRRHSCWRRPSTRRRTLFRIAQPRISSYAPSSVRHSPTRPFCQL